MDAKGLATTVGTILAPLVGQATSRTVVDRMAITHLQDPFGSPYRVGLAAVSTTAAAIGSIAALESFRSGRPVDDIVIDCRHACLAFHSERHVRVQDLADAELWDPIAGNYATADGWIRLHTNMAPHRQAVLDVLGVPAERAAVTEAVAAWPGRDLESAVITAGGVAAVMRTANEWHDHPQHGAMDAEPLVDIRAGTAGTTLASSIGDDASLLDGLRILDLSRVIAGPVAGRLLASWGADVIAVDAPLDDHPLAQADLRAGKRAVPLDLRDDGDRATFEELVAGADVVLEGFRPGALAGLGYDHGDLADLRPGIVSAHLSAWGELGPWAPRRGFDSVVQVATGMAHTCGFDPATGPGSLPAQALDHAAGHLLATGIVAGLLRREHWGTSQRVGVSLARTGEWLTWLGLRRDQAPQDLTDEFIADRLTTREEPGLGEVTRIAPVGQVGDRRATWPVVASASTTAAWA